MSKKSLILIVMAIALLLLPLYYTDYLGTKSLHVIFVISWMAGLFYLPRIFVNMAIEQQGPAYDRLLIMAHKLFVFMTLLAVPAVAYGLWLYLGAFVQLPYPSFHQQGWMHAKLLAVLILIGYHHGCYSLLKKFAAGKNTRSHIFYRWFNEVPVVLLIIIVVLVVVKPF